MSMMNGVFHYYLDKFILIFIDDILVYSRSIEEHKEHLRIVLQTLRKNQLFAKFSKCDFYKDQIQYLGHVISSEGIVVNPEKIKTIMNWPVPANVADIRSFMELAGYYRRFIRGFTKVAYPITSLQREQLSNGRNPVPNQLPLKQSMLDEFHRSPYAAHQGYQNILTAIKKSYYWLGMRKDIVEYLAKCLECQQVKEEHQHPAGLLRPLPIPEWKWEL
eukprot:PITA_19073